MKTITRYTLDEVISGEWASQSSAIANLKAAFSNQLPDRAFRSINPHYYEQGEPAPAMYFMNTEVLLRFLNAGLLSQRAFIQSIVRLMTRGSGINESSIEIEIPWNKNGGTKFLTALYLKGTVQRLEFCLA